MRLLVSVVFDLLEARRGESAFELAADRCRALQIGEVLENEEVPHHRAVPRGDGLDAHAHRERLARFPNEVELAPPRLLVRRQRHHQSANGVGLDEEVGRVSSGCVQPRESEHCLAHEEGVAARIADDNKTGRKLHVNDSKAVYSPSIGLGELEKSVLAIAGCVHAFPDDLDGLLRCVASHAMGELADHRWYGRHEAEKFPREHEAVAVKMIGNALRHEMEKTQTTCVHLAARVVSERPLNRLFHHTRNKSNTLFSVASIHLDELVRKFGEQNLTIICDRQGGRAHYGPLLQQIFEDWSLEIVEHSAGYSEYKLTRGSHAVTIAFAEKAEGLSMSVAVASMLCKYLRETLMHRFNAYWQTQQPGVTPTAGYYNDGLRFLEDITETRARLGVTDDELIRSR